MTSSFSRAVLLSVVLEKKLCWNLKNQTIVFMRKSIGIQYVVRHNNFQIVYNLY